MASSTFQPLQSLLVNGSHRFAVCWTIIRKDGFTLRFTDHDRDLIVDGNTYKAGTFQASARQRKDGFDPQNVEVKGTFTDDSITNDDLRAGFYREAKISEFTVDWRFPFAGKFYTNTYYVESTSFSDETWMATAAGILLRLRPKVGGVFSRKCRWKRFGDEDCTFDLATVEQVNRNVNVITESRLAFTTTNLASQPDDYYNDGLITWTDGDNTGTTSEVKSWKQGTGVVSLHVQTPFPIATGDKFTITPGCPRIEEACIRFHGHLRHYGGFPDIPNNDTYLTTPDAKG